MYHIRYTIKSDWGIRLKASLRDAMRLIPDAFYDAHIGPSPSELSDYTYHITLILSRQAPL